MAPLRPIHPLLVALAAVIASATLSACGSEIGDGCSLSTDCSPEGDRVCDISSPGGYCTQIGCDYDTCPGEAECVRFFSVNSSNRTCNPRTEDDTTNDCTADELCALSGTCVPRLAEVRFCMRKCSSNGDCRDGYECRNEMLMQEHGGEPVPPPGQPLGDNLQGFCAAKPL